MAQRIRETVGTEDQWAQKTRGFRGPVGERTSEHSRPEEEWVIGPVGTEDQ